MVNCSKCGDNIILDGFNVESTDVFDRQSFKLVLCGCCNTKVYKYGTTKDSDIKDSNINSNKNN